MKIFSSDLNQIYTKPPLTKKKNPWNGTFIKNYLTDWESNPFFEICKNRVVGTNNKY